MHSKERKLILSIVFLLFSTNTLFAQGLRGTIEGTVKKRNPDGTFVPVAGAIIDIYRTDGINQHWELKTNKEGRWLIMGMFLHKKYLVVASGPGIRYTWIQIGKYDSWAGKGRSGSLPPIELVAFPGDGRRPIFEEVKSRVAPDKVTAEDRARIYHERAASREHAKPKEELQATYERYVRYYNRGKDLTRADPPDHQAALVEFGTAADIDPTQNAAFAELSCQANANLAESHYNVGVDLFNERKRDQARDHFDQAIQAIRRAISIAYSLPNSIVGRDLLVHYSILAKNAKILVKYYGLLVLIDPTVMALEKAAALDSDKDKWRKIQDELRSMSQPKR